MLSQTILPPWYCKDLVGPTLPWLYKWGTRGLERLSNWFQGHTVIKSHS